MEGQSGRAECPHPHTDSHYQSCLLTVLVFFIINPEDPVGDVRRNAGTSYAQWLCQDTEIHCCAVHRTRKSIEEGTAERKSPKRIARRAAVRIGYGTSVCQLCVIVLL